MTSAPSAELWSQPFALTRLLFKTRGGSGRDPPRGGRGYPPGGGGCPGGRPGGGVPGEPKNRGPEEKNHPEKRPPNIFPAGPGGGGFDAKEKPETNFK